MLNTIIYLYVKYNCIPICYIQLYTHMLNTIIYLYVKYKGIPIC